MTQPDDVPHNSAASEQVQPPEPLPTGSQPPEPKPNELELASMPDKDNSASPLDVDYLFPSPPEAGGRVGTIAEAVDTELSDVSALDRPTLEGLAPEERPIDFGSVPDVESSGLTGSAVELNEAATATHSAASDSPVPSDTPTISSSSPTPANPTAGNPTAIHPTPLDSAAPVVSVEPARPAPADSSTSPEPLGGPEVSPPPSTSDLASFATGELEEETYAPTVAVQGPQAGEVVSGYQLNQDLGRGWFSANALGAGPSVDVYVRPKPLWAELRPHRLLPKVTPAGDLWVLAPTEGAPLNLPLDAATAQAHLTELARLLFALEKQSYAVTDLDPASMQHTPEGLKLRLPPQVARLGEAAQPTLRDSFTPPEVQEGQPAQAKSGVYLLGALFFQWLTGQPLPAEGPSSVVLAGVQASGVPQLLSGMLAPLPQRLTPTELLAALKTAATKLPIYQLAAATDIGLNPERPINEDSYGFVWRQIGQHGGGELMVRAVVSDGMGGMAAGEVASQAAVRAFLTSETTSFEASSLEALVWEANAAVLTDMQGRDGGCTITGIEIRGTQLQMAHVGDTRAYVAQNGAVQQLSKDHSYVAAMVASGQMTAEEAQVSPERNKVLRSLGSLRTPQDNYVQVLPEPLELTVGSRVLLLSDGVWGEVLPPVLHDILLHEPSLQRIVDRLIELSLQSGAPDNATALVIERVR